VTPCASCGKPLRRTSHRDRRFCSREHLEKFALAIQKRVKEKK
jgi:hypothetical protein